MLQTQRPCIIVFEGFPKEIECEHIKRQVHKIGVNQSVCYKPIILPLHMDGGGPEDQGLFHRVIGVGDEGDDGGKDNDRYRETGHREFFLCGPAAVGG